MNWWNAPQGPSGPPVASREEPSDPRNAAPQAITRAVRCPRCSAVFETARRFQMACLECGHEWQEESHRGAGDKLSDAVAELPERAGFAIIWAGLLAFLGSLPALIDYYLWTIAQRSLYDAAMALLLLLLAAGLMLGTVWTRSSGRWGAWGWLNDRWWWRR